MSESLVATVAVDRVTQLSPSFRRITLTGSDLRDFDADAGLDTRVKLVFPSPTGSLLPAGPNWYESWCAMAEDGRCPLRTYTVAGVEPAADGGCRVQIDFALHDVDDGRIGPACAFALGARPGDVVQLIGPRRGQQEYGGVEFRPGDASQLLLVADATALPALARILESLPRNASGTAFIEVPTTDDVRPLTAPENVDIHWLTTSHRVGDEAVRAVRAGLGLPPTDEVTVTSRGDESELPWETPSFSATGEPLQSAPPRTGRYAWVAGEARMVKTLRRSLIQELGLHRSQVAAMGYWREGVSVRG